MFVSAWRDAEHCKDRHNRRQKGGVCDVSADTNPSTGTKGIAYGVVIEVTVCAEESFGFELLRVGIPCFVADHGPGEVDIRYCVQDVQRMGQPDVHDDCHSYRKSLSNQGQTVVESQTLGNEITTIDICTCCGMWDAWVVGTSDTIGR